MLVHGSSARPRQALGLGAAGALLRAGVALPKNGPAVKRQKPPSQPDAACEVREVPEASQQPDASCEVREVPAASHQHSETEAKAQLSCLRFRIWFSWHWAQLLGFGIGEVAKAQDMVAKALAPEESVAKPEEALPADPAQPEAEESAHETAAHSTSPEKLDSLTKEEGNESPSVGHGDDGDKITEYCVWTGKELKALKESEMTVFQDCSTRKLWKPSSHDEFCYYDENTSEYVFYHLDNNYVVVEVKRELIPSPEVERTPSKASLSTALSSTSLRSLSAGQEEYGAAERRKKEAILAKLDAAGRRTPSSTWNDSAAFRSLVTERPVSQRCGGA